MRFIRQSNGQIRARTTFILYDGRTITAGTLGGTIASSRNLAQSGTSWVFPNGKIEGNSFV
jgi:8-oxo-dGTP pyrophosphatase MutT (NUDIX family)